MKNWYSLFTKPQRESQVSEILTERNLETYLPMLQVRRRGRTVMRPFFPRYMFLHVDFDEVGLSAVQWTPGLSDIVSFGEHAAQVPDAIIKRLKDELYVLNNDGVYSPFSKGDKVRIISGPLQDFEAVFDKHLSSDDRVRILVDVLGKLTRTDINFDDIELVG